MRNYFLLFILILIYSCTPTKRIGKTAQKNVIESKALSNAHIGISIFEPATGKWWYRYQDDKYFVPASNTKLATCYAAMKYLGDSLAGMDYLETDSVLFIRATADPTFLHRDYKTQPAFAFLKKQTKKLCYVFPNPDVEAYGDGWAWNDYNEGYMAERSELPIYGNVIEYKLQKNNKSYILNGDIPFFKYALNSLVDSLSPHIQITRIRYENTFYVQPAKGNFSTVQIPFRTYQNQRLLEDTLKKAWLDKVSPPINAKFISIHSQPTDSLLKPMMHRSDNFFAEQSLLMVSNSRLGYMSDAKIIDNLLQTDFKDLPQKPRWVDGSGLSRYNLFSPQDFVTILNKMKSEFGMERIKNILATGNNGTLTNYYKADSTYIFAKTGTLSGVVAISGFLYTKQNKLLLFSVLVNNHNAAATEVRRTIEKFIEGIRNQY